MSKWFVKVSANPADLPIKAKEMKRWLCNEYHHVLLLDDMSVVQMNERCMQHAALLNEQYFKGLPLRVERLNRKDFDEENRCIILEVWPNVAFICLDRVKGELSAVAFDSKTKKK